MVEVLLNIDGNERFIQIKALKLFYCSKHSMIAEILAYGSFVLMELFIELIRCIHPRCSHQVVTSN